MLQAMASTSDKRLPPFLDGALEPANSMLTEVNLDCMHPLLHALSPRTVATPFCMATVSLSALTVTTVF